MKTALFCAIIAITFFVYSVSVFATDYSSINFTVKDPVVVPGAGFATTTDFQLITSIAQGVIGESTSASFKLKQGFLYFPGPSSAGGGGTPPVIIVGGGGGGGAQTPASTSTPPLPQLPHGKSCDFNRSGRCDIFDFSILLSFYGEPVTSATEEYDLTSDGRIDFYDLSVLFYYWII